jgi:hypothetical protein
MRMIYLSKGILPWKPSKAAVSVSRCGALHKLTGDEALLWLAGQRRPGHTQNADQDSALKLLAELGVAECCDDSDGAAVFRLLTGCVICPVRVKTRPALLSRCERRMRKWIGRAGLRLTIAELTLLAERGVRPTSALLGEQNRRALVEAIYTPETDPRVIPETTAEKSPARDGVVRAVLGLLRKQKIFLI